MHNVPIRYIKVLKGQYLTLCMYQLIKPKGRWDVSGLCQTAEQDSLCSRQSQQNSAPLKTRITMQSYACL